MLAGPQRSESEAQLLRRQAGRWLKQKREERNLSQRQLADLLSLDYYTFISQLETGRGRIPPERYVDWARSLGMKPRDFVYVLMRYYDPITFSILFPDAEAVDLKFRENA
jgi:transcriptional regulator with XRE-family HTH domain